MMTSVPSGGPSWPILLEADRGAFSRHQHYVNQYFQYYRLRPEEASRNAAVAAYKTDADIIRQEHEFIRDDEADHTADASASARGKRWEAELAKKYWDRLYKEYALADTSRYREGQLGLRWRTEQEVISGKGQFMCGALNCDGVLGLHSYEVVFRYVEKGVAKAALVKLRLCGNCAPKLFYKGLLAKLNAKAAAAAAAAAAPSTAGSTAASDHASNGDKRRHKHSSRHHDGHKHGSRRHSRHRHGRHHPSAEGASVGSSSVGSSHSGSGRGRGRSRSKRSHSRSRSASRTSASSVTSSETDSSTSDEESAPASGVATGSGAGGASPMAAERERSLRKEMRLRQRLARKRKRREASRHSRHNRHEHSKHRRHDKEGTVASGAPTQDKAPAGDLTAASSNGGAGVSARSDGAGAVAGARNERVQGPQQPATVTSDPFFGLFG